jgi:23S rRNA pseudouridine2605 synthase
VCGSLAASTKGYVLSSTPEFNAEQLTAARAKVWHQTGEPLLTLDAVREWLSTAGLVLFTPRSLQLPTPAPSFVEATLGSANVGPTPAQIEAARTILVRLVSEGNALPLNLLGIPGELPDFVVSAQIFSYIFTMRGDKAWKLPPSTTGAVKVSPLGLRVYEVLAERGAMTAAELASELGREVTEGAILRTLNELWSLLRVIPLPQMGEASTLWELATRRFTKAIKAGINAGQPKALSALISLYLAQSLLATEDEVETFLSPLAARSRIREVLHALTSSRQLETIVLEGKSLLHIPGTLPEFPAIAKPEPTEEEIAAAAAASLEGEGRIKRFTPSAGSKPRGEFKGKPARSFGERAGGSGGTGTRGARPSTPRTGDRPDRERRPFNRDGASAGSKPSFTRPWSEDRKPRPERAGFTPRAEGDSAAPKRPYVRREGAAPGGFAKREGGFSDRGPARKSFGDKPAFRKDRGEGFATKPRFAQDGERKPYARREGAAPSDAPRRTYGEKPGGRDSFAKFRKPEGDRKPFRRDEGEGSSPRPSFKPSFTPRPTGDRPFSKPRFDRGDSKPGGYVSKSGGFAGKSRDFSSKPGGFAPKRPYVRRDEGAGSSYGGGDRPERPAYGGSDSTPRAPKRPFPRKEGDLADRPVRPWPEHKPERSDSKSRKPGGFGKRPFTPREGGSGDRPRPSFGGKRPFGSKPAGGFSKRPDSRGGAPFSKRPAGAGGFTPAARKPESEE